MSDQACKSEEQHRIDTLQEMANTEHQLRMSRTQYESAKHELVRAAEALLEWQGHWDRERRAVFACYPDAMPVDSVLEDARVTMDRFCADIEARHAAYGKPAPTPIVNTDEGWELEPASIPEPETQTGEGVEIPEGFTKWDGGEWTGKPRDAVQVVFESGVITEIYHTVEDEARFWHWPWDGKSDRIVAFKVVAPGPDEPVGTDEPDDASEFAESEGDVPNEIEASASGATLPTNDACALPGGVEESRDQFEEEAERAAAIELTADVEPLPQPEQNDYDTTGVLTADDMQAVAMPNFAEYPAPVTEGYAPVVDNAEAHIQAVEAERYAQPTNPDADFWARGLAPAEPEKKHRFSIFGHKRETEEVG